MPQAAKRGGRSQAAQGGAVCGMEGDTWRHRRTPSTALPSPTYKTANETELSTTFGNNTGQLTRKASHLGRRTSAPRGPARRNQPRRPCERQRDVLLGAALRLPTNAGTSGSYPRARGLEQGRVRPEGMSGGQISLLTGACRSRAGMGSPVASSPARPRARPLTKPRRGPAW